MALLFPSGQRRVAHDGVEGCLRMLPSSPEHKKRRSLLVLGLLLLSVIACRSILRPWRSLASRSSQADSALSIHRCAEPDTLELSAVAQQALKAAATAISSADVVANSTAAMTKSAAEGLRHASNIAKARSAQSAASSMGAMQLALNRTTSLFHWSALKSSRLARIAAVQSRVAVRRNTGKACAGFASAARAAAEIADAAAEGIQEPSAEKQHSEPTKLETSWIFRKQTFLASLLTCGMTYCMGV